MCCELFLRTPYRVHCNTFIVILPLKFQTFIYLPVNKLEFFIYQNYASQH